MEWQKKYLQDSNDRKIDNLLCDKQDRILIPKEKLSTFIERLHEKPVHPGECKLYHTINKFFSSPGLKSEIKKLGQNCDKCRLSKINTTKYGISEGHIISSEPLSFISSDIIGPLKTEHFLNNTDVPYFYFVTFTDIYSRWTEVSLIYNIKSESIILKFKEWIRKFGCPGRILTDLGRQYISSKFQRFLQERSIKHIQISPYSPTANSISERINRTIGDVCRISKGTVLENLPQLIMTKHNYTYHRSIKTSPFEKLKGYSLLDPLKRSLVKSIEQKEKNEIQNRANIKGLKKGYKFEKGEYVYVRLHNQDKILDKWKGPFKILKISKTGNAVYIDEGSKINRQSIKNIRPSFRGGRML